MRLAMIIVMLRRMSRVAKYAGLANRGTGDDRFAIDLSSDRVRDALAILDAVREGRSLRALLGYRVERGLREHDLELAQYILDLRRYAPLRTSVGPAHQIDPSGVSANP